VEIMSLARVALAGALLTIEVRCSKGTYIRTLAMDIGRALGCGAHLRALRRTASGPFVLEDAVTLAQLEQEGVEAARQRLLPMASMVAGLPRVELPQDSGRRFRHGQVVSHSAAGEGSEWALFDEGGAFLGIGRAARAGELAPERVVSFAPGEVP
jgi:tRNA pseudouridine55 synthase